MPVPPNFYQVQLIVLAFFCFVAILVERWVDNRKKAAAEAGDRASANAEEAAPLTGEGAKASQGAFSALRRSYLLVYAVVMGELSRH